MENIKSDKIERVLGIYTKLMNGYLVSKAEESANYGVNERSIQRDIDDEAVRKGFDIISDSFPTIYRIDRIKGLTVLDEKFHIPYSSRFEER